MEKKNNYREKLVNPDTDALWEVILQLKNIEEARLFFRDLLTEQEILEFANRWKVARMLAKKVPYLEIGRQTWMSSTTIARIQRWLKQGRGGYRLMLERTAKAKKN